MTASKVQAAQRQVDARAIPFQAALQQRLDRIVREEIRRILAELNLPRKVTKASTPDEDAAAIRQVLALFGMREVQNAEQREAEARLSPALLRRFKPHAQSFGWKPKRGSQLSARQLDRLKGAGLVEVQRRAGSIHFRAIPQTESIASQVFEARLETQAREIVATTRSEAREMARAVAAEAMEEETRPSIGQIARRIREAGADVTGERAAVIARDTLASASNSGRMAGFEATGVQEIEWLAVTSDRRSGDRQHWKMNGDRVRLGESFKTPNGHAIRYPHDPAAPVSETANCRCMTRPVG